MPQQDSEGGRHHEQAKLQAHEAWRGWFPCSSRGGSFCWGRMVTFDFQRWAGICRDRYVPLARK